MDDQLRQSLLASAKQLAQEYHRRLEATGILVDLEELTAEITDELRREITKIDDQTAYHRYAEWVWQGKVSHVIDGLHNHQQHLELPPPEISPFRGLHPGGFIRQNCTRRVWECAV